MNRTKLAICAVGIVAAASLTGAGAASAATITPTPVGTYQAHHAPPNSFYVCLWTRASGMIGGADGPYAWDVQAIADCRTNKAAHPAMFPTVHLVVSTP